MNGARRLLRRWVLGAGGLVLLGAGLLAGVGEMLSAPAHGVVGPPPSGLDARPVHIKTASGDTIAGWLTAGRPGAGAVLLLHGLRADRRQMLARATALQRIGPATLLIDLPAHGESSGARIGFGHHEAAGVVAALHFLQRTLPGEKTGVIGVSLGAAAFVLAPDTPPVAAVVLESMYPDIEDALANRLHLHAGAPGAWFAPLLLAQLPWRLGVDAGQLRPIDRLATLQAPLLVVAGAADRHTTPAAARRLAAAAAPPATLWLVNGAAHQDLHAFDAPAYESRVFGFLLPRLRAGP